MMALREGLPGTIYRKDYVAPDFTVQKVDLLVQIKPGRTEVTAALEISRQAGQGCRRMIMRSVIPSC